MKNSFHNKQKLSHKINYQNAGLTTLALVLGMAQTANSATKGVVFSSSMKSSAIPETAYSVTEEDLQKAMKKYCIPVNQFNCQNNKLAKWNSKTQKCDCTGDPNAVWYPEKRECQCPAGYGYKNGLCTACTGATYSTGETMVCTSCGVGVKTCDVNTGKVLSCASGYILKGNECKTCPAGQYLSGNACTICPAGSYCPDGVNKYGCPNYTWSSAGASACNKCSGSVGLYNYPSRSAHSSKSYGSFSFSCHESYYKRGDLSIHICGHEIDFGCCGKYNSCDYSRKSSWRYWTARVYCNKTNGRTYFSIDGETTEMDGQSVQNVYCN